MVLFFYPLDFTFVCPTEITAFSDRHDDFAAINTEVGYGGWDGWPCVCMWEQCCCWSDADVVVVLCHDSWEEGS